MTRLCILHFQPVEKYPPAINFLRLLGLSASTTQEIHLFTTDSGKGKENISIPGIRIYRIGKWREGMGKFSRLLFYTRFVLTSLLKLVKYKPSVVMYYETVSAGAPYLYKKWIRPSCPIVIHYHEYTSSEEYQSGMILNRWLHRLELSLYKKAEWVSHTNEDRVRLFLQDTGKWAPSRPMILPNHPPASWSTHSQINRPAAGSPIAFVYVGALSLEHLYVKEMAEWIASRPHDCYWNIYSDNMAPGVLDYFDQLGASNIFFNGAVNYDELPGILSKHNIGTILYKGHIPNYIYNIPNKLFEYHVCGLDTWYPRQMVTCASLNTTDSFPKIVPVDFIHLNLLSLSELINRDNLRYHKQEYSCEETYSGLIRWISKLSTEVKK